MKSIRTEQRRAKNKSQILTMGGTGEYYITKSEIGELAQIINSSPKKRLVEVLDALFTKKELVDTTRRVIVAKMLLANKTFVEISEQTNASKSTIVLVKQSLNEHNGLLREILTQYVRTSPQPEMRSPVENYFRNRIRKGK